MCAPIVLSSRLHRCFRLPFAMSSNCSIARMRGAGFKPPNGKERRRDQGVFASLPFRFFQESLRTLIESVLRYSHLFVACTYRNRKIEGSDGLALLVWSTSPVPFAPLLVHPSCSHERLLLGERRMRVFATSRTYIVLSPNPLLVYTSANPALDCHLEPLACPSAVLNRQEGSLVNYSLSTDWCSQWWGRVE